MAKHHTKRRSSKTREIWIIVLGILVLTAGFIIYSLIPQESSDEIILPEAELSEIAQNKDPSDMNLQSEATTPEALSASEVAYHSGVLELQSNLKMITGIIRNTGNGWEFVVEAENQENTNCISVGISENDGRLYVDYSGMNAKKVVSLIATPDEVLANNGYVIGTSVEEDNAYIQISQYSLDSVSANIRFSNEDAGTIISIENVDGVSSAVWNDERKTLDITHDICLDNDTASEAPFISIIPSLYGKYIIRLNSYSSTETNVEFIDPVTEQKVAAPDANMSFSFSRVSSALTKKEIDAGTLKNLDGNIWFVGVFEVE